MSNNNRHPSPCESPDHAHHRYEVLPPHLMMESTRSGKAWNPKQQQKQQPELNEDDWDYSFEQQHHQQQHHYHQQRHHQQHHHQQQRIVPHSNKNKTSQQLSKTVTDLFLCGALPTSQIACGSTKKKKHPSSSTSSKSKSFLCMTQSPSSRSSQQCLVQDPRRFYPSNNSTRLASSQRQLLDGLFSEEKTMEKMEQQRQHHHHESRKKRLQPPPPVHLVPCEDDECVSEDDVDDLSTTPTTGYEEGSKKNGTGAMENETQESQYQGVDHRGNQISPISAANRQHRRAHQQQHSNGGASPPAAPARRSKFRTFADKDTFPPDLEKLSSDDDNNDDQQTIVDNYNDSDNGHSNEDEELIGAVRRRLAMFRERRLKQQEREPKKVHFCHPPVTRILHRPFTAEEDIPLLYFTEEELDEMKNDRMMECDRVELELKEDGDDDNNNDSMSNHMAKVSVKYKDCYASKRFRRRKKQQQHQRQYDVDYHQHHHMGYITHNTPVVPPSMSVDETREEWEDGEDESVLSAGYA